MKREALTKIACLFWCISLVGCYTAKYMRPAPALAPARADAGRIVFVRPSGYPTGLGATIVDEEGRYVGDAAPKSQFAVFAPPGRHVYIVWAENTDAVEIEVAAGHTYYVEVAPTVGAFSAQVHLYAISPTQPQWAHLRDWLAKTKTLAPDVAGGQAYLAKRQEKLQERVRRGLEHIDRYRAEGDRRHFLAAADGVAGSL